MGRPVPRRRTDGIPHAARGSLVHLFAVEGGPHLERGGGAAAQESLHFVARLVVEELELFLGFDTLRDHPQLEAVRHRDDCRDDRGLVTRLLELFHE